MTRSSPLVMGVVALVVGIAASANSNAAGSSESVLAEARRPLAFGAIALKSTAYTGGSVDFDMEIVNPNAKDMTAKLAFGAAGSGIFARDVPVKGMAKAHESFTDGPGLSTVCSPKEYGFDLLENGMSSYTRIRVMPTCHFGTKVDNSWSDSSPDNVDAQQHGKLCLDWMNAPTSPSCGSAIHVTGRLVNRSSKDAKGVKVELWNGAKLVATSAPVNLAKGKGADAPFDLPVGTIGKLTAKLTDPTNSVGGSLVSAYITVNVTPTCALSATKLP